MNCLNCREENAPPIIIRTDGRWADGGWTDGACFRCCKKCQNIFNTSSSIKLEEITEDEYLVYEVMES